MGDIKRDWAFALLVIVWFFCGVISYPFRLVGFLVGKGYRYKKSKGRYPPKYMWPKIRT